MSIMSEDEVKLQARMRAIRDGEPALIACDADEGTGIEEVNVFVGDDKEPTFTIMLSDLLIAVERHREWSVAVRELERRLPWPYAGGGSVGGGAAGGSL